MFGIGLGLCTTLLGSSAVPFNPSQVSGYAADYDLSRNATVAGGHITALGDSSGSGDSNKNLTNVKDVFTAGIVYTAADSSYGNQPTFTTDAFKGLYSGTWAVALTQPFTIVMVGQGTVDSDEICGTISGTNSAEITRKASTHVAGIYAGGGAYIYSTTDISVPAIMIGIYNGASSKFYGSSNTAQSLVGDIGAAGLPGFMLGNGSVDRGNVGGAKIARCIIYSGAISDANAVKLNTYLSALYGITVT